MSTHPRTEARVSALERRQTNLEIRIEELSEATTNGLKGLSDTITDNVKQIAEYEISTKDEIDTRFNQVDTQLTAFQNQVDARFNQVDARFSQVDTRLNTIETDITTLKSDVTTLKGDVSAMRLTMTDMQGQLTTIISLLKPS